MVFNNGVSIVENHGIRSLYSMIANKAGSQFYDQSRSLKMTFFTLSALMIYLFIGAGESCTKVSF